MDSNRFDRLTKSLSTPGTRRARLRLLADTPVASGVLRLLEPEAAAKKKNKNTTKLAF